MGYWNANLLAPLESDTRYVNNLMSNLSFKLVDTGPSHHTTDNDTWIDSIFIDECDSILCSTRFLPPFPSRHEIISVTIDIFYADPPDSSYSYIPLNTIIPNDLNLHLNKSDWSAYALSDENFSIDEGLSTLTDNINDAIDKLAPEKKLNIKKSNYPWIDSELRLLRAKRDAISRRYTRTGSPKLLNEFLSLAKSFEEKSEAARHAYMHNRICNTLDANKDFWKEMRMLGLIPKVNDALHGFLPEELNLYFSNISISPTEDNLISLNVINNAPPDGFVFKRVSVNDVILAVSHFKTQAKGDDGIPQSVIAKALPVIAPHLTKLFNASLMQGNFPTAWKNSCIMAIKKVQVPSSTSDFRPVALLCFLSKVLEKLTHDQIDNFLNKSKILDQFQTGFRKYHSTQSALLKLTDDIKLGKDRRLATLLLQFDFSKAFDNVSPSKLLNKLKDIGFSKFSLQWIWTYISGRSMCVTSKTSKSSSREINIGVPQRSVLGPLLFCIYINDLKDHLVDSNTFRLLYADNLQIYVQVPINEIELGISKLSDSAKKVSQWAELNSLSLNAKKTQAIVFGSSSTIKAFRELNINCIDINNRGDTVSFVDEITSLGIKLDNTLSWRSQVLQVTKNVNRVLYFLKTIRPCTSLSLRRRLVESLVVPHLDYCTVVYSDVCNELRTQLQRLANAGIRYIYGVRRHEHITPFRRKLGWMTTSTRTNYFASLIMYRIIRLKEPPLLTSFFRSYKPDRPVRGPRKDLEPISVTTD